MNTDDPRALRLHPRGTVRALRRLRVPPRPVDDETSPTRVCRSLACPRGRPNGPGARGHVEEGGAAELGLQSAAARFPRPVPESLGRAVCVAVCASRAACRGSSRLAGGVITRRNGLRGGGQAVLGAEPGGWHSCLGEGGDRGRPSA